MKKLLLVSLLLGSVSLSAQILTVDPPQPKMGDRISVTYDPSAQGAALSGKVPISAEALLLSPKESPVLKEFPLKKTGKKWTGGFPLPQDQTALILLRFLAGDDVDGNGGNAWHVVVHGQDGKPVRGARVLLASFLLSGMLDFKHEKDYPGAYTALAEERSGYPENSAAYVLEWGTRAREKRGDAVVLKRIQEELDPFLERFKGEEEAIASVLNLLEQTGQKERADSIRKSAIERNPQGPIAEATATERIFRERDPLKRADLIERFLSEFPKEGRVRESMQSLLVSSYQQGKETGKALGALERVKNPGAMLLNNLAWGMVEKGESLPEAERLAKRGVDQARNPPAADLPAYLSAKKRQEAIDQNLGMVLDTYGAALLKQGKGKEAVAVMEEAVALSRGESAEYTERLLEAYLLTGENRKGVAAGRKAVERGKTTEKLMDQLKSAFTASGGSSAGYQKLLAEAKKKSAGDLKTKLLKSRLNKPAIPWSLKDLNGRPVALTDLKGKVVVVDFWATWCGPCIRSFPTLQKVTDKYRQNPAVAILAFNTWERVVGKEREDLVKKFIADNKYSFRVVYDEGMVDKYGVEGIPTKFIIDKKGKLAFSSIGFDRADEMYTELTAQIDLLLAE